VLSAEASLNRRHLSLRARDCALSIAREQLDGRMTKLFGDVADCAAIVVGSCRVETMARRIDSISPTPAAE
jgi:hypothetical protein